MRFEPQPCAEFPNDNPELHNGALWVSGFCRARPRAIVSAESVARAVARETAAAEMSARAVARETEQRPLELVEAQLEEPPPFEAEPYVEQTAAEMTAVEPAEMVLGELAVAEPPPEAEPPALEEELAVTEPPLEVAEMAVESVFARLDDVFAAEDFSATPPPVEVAAAELVGAVELDFGTLELEPEHVASVVAELDELFEEPPDAWQTPVSAVELRLLDVNVAEVAPFRVPRPDSSDAAEELPSLQGAVTAAELEPLSLDLTPPPPGVAGWAQLSALLSTFLLERGATRAAALLPKLLDGRRIQLERLSEETRQCLREANIAEATTDGCWPTADFQRQAVALYLDHKNGQAKDVLRWVSDVVRALLANSMSHAAIRAHLEEAGVKALLSRAA